MHIRVYFFLFYKTVSFLKARSYVFFFFFIFVPPIGFNVLPSNSKFVVNDCLMKPGSFCPSAFLFSSDQYITNSASLPEKGTLPCPFHRALTCKEMLMSDISEHRCVRFYVNRSWVAIGTFIKEITL